MILNWCLTVTISQTYSAASRHSLEGEDRGRVERVGKYFGDDILGYRRE